jgi:SNF2 family DNA or RNA helicase
VESGSCIGQKKNVIVHKFICKGTIEDRINDMIEDKKSLAGEVIKNGTESWITELDNTGDVQLVD